ncbi:MAG: hypothetical protein HQ546_10095 [Planctomycetes bacterium]|nr:hypothetical protein [Planctomycetota bacterium]
MSNSLKNALSALRDLGDVGQMWELAASGHGPADRPGCNLHIHLPPNFSAFQSVAQAIELADEQGVSVLGASNYYDFGVYALFADHARRRGIFPVFGTEIISLHQDALRDGMKINDPGNPGKMYICGKGITRLAPLSDQATGLLAIIRQGDAERMKKMTAKLAEVFARRGLATSLDTKAIVEMVVRRHGCAHEAVVLQERHLAQAFQEILFKKTPPDERADRLSEIIDADYQLDPDDCVAIQGEIRSRLMKAGKAAFIEESFIDFDQARRLILQLGGIPCYPTLADGADPICQFEQPIEKLIDRIKAIGVACVEFIPIRNRPEVLGRYVRAMRRAGLVVTAGTEHNTLDLLPIEPTCLGGEPIDEDIRDIFWEGACVVAGHQFLTLHGKCGFVDTDGNVNNAYARDEQRIAAFAALGAAVIQRYYDRLGLRHEA